MQNNAVRDVSSLQSGFECSSLVAGDGDSGYFGSAIASSMSRKQVSQLFHPVEEATSVEAV
jgi:hypothetical protein